jgi:hypothetical protein
VDVEQFCTNIYLLDFNYKCDVPFNINRYIINNRDYISISNICAAVFDNDYKQEHTYVRVFQALPESNVIMHKLWHRRAADPLETMDYLIPMDEITQFMDWIASDLMAKKQRKHWIRAMEAKYDFVTDAASLKCRES